VLGAMPAITELISTATKRSMPVTYVEIVLSNESPNKVGSFSVFTTHMDLEGNLLKQIDISALDLAEFCTKLLN
jgi:hypothetical protein